MASKAKMLMAESSENAWCVQYESNFKELLNSYDVFIIIIQKNKMWIFIY